MIRLLLFLLGASVALADSPIGSKTSRCLGLHFGNYQYENENWVTLDDAVCRALDPAVCIPLGAACVSSGQCCEGFCVDSVCANIGCDALLGCTEIGPCFDGIHSSDPIDEGVTCELPSIRMTDVAGDMSQIGSLDLFDGISTTEPARLQRDAAGDPQSAIIRRRLGIQESLHIGIEDPPLHLQPGMWFTTCVEDPGPCDATFFGVHYFDCTDKVDCVCDGATWCQVGDPDECGTADSCVGASTTTTSSTVTTTSTAPATTTTTSGGSTTTSSTTTTTTTTTTSTTLSLLGAAFYPGYPGTYTSSNNPNPFLMCGVIRMTAGIDNASELAAGFRGGGNCTIAIYPDDDAGAMLGSVTDTCPTEGVVQGTTSAFDMFAGAQYRVCVCMDEIDTDYLAVYNSDLTGLVNATSTAIGYGNACTDPGAVPPATTGALTAPGPIVFHQFPWIVIDP